MKQFDFKVIENIGKIDGKEPKVAWHEDWYEFQKMEYRGVVFYCRIKCRMEIITGSTLLEKRISSCSCALDLDAKLWTSGKKEFITKKLRIGLFP